MTNEEKMLDILAGLQNEMVAMNGRIDSIDGRMGSMENKIEIMDNRIVKIEFKLETDFEVKMDALAEGHAAILEQLTPRSRIDEMDNRIKFLETMLQSLASELHQLKKAQ